MKAFTWLGSTAVIVPLGLALGGWFMFRRRDRRALTMLVAAVGGAIVTYQIVKPAVGRPRPPASAWIGRYSGAAFPSGHATQAVAFYAIAAIVLSAGGAMRTRVAVWSGAAGVVFVVGFSRLYLGAHWLTDVLGGYALGVTWVALVSAVRLSRSRPSRDDSLQRLPPSRKPRGQAA